MGDQTSEVEDLERIFTDTNAEPIKISYAAIKYITKNFAQEIGDGGFGVVYLGSLKKGMVAVKKLFASKKDFSDDQFLDEVTCLKKVNHINIVRFLGYCADTHGEVMEIEGKHRIVEVQQRLLCFEYVPNGNLRHYLKEKSHGYEWNVRYQIIKGICQGLRYVHQEKIYHLDLKPANVLLGANMEPKITDFGVSRCIGEQSTIVTKNFFGTLGYVAPEFIDKQQISLKSDIYSLGVIIINLLTGCHGPITENWHTSVDADSPQMKRCIEIAQICINRDPHKRPTTDEIIHSLKETETIYHASQTYKPKINEPRVDPRSELHQIVHRFLALPAEKLREHPRVDTIYMELDVPECLLEGSNKPGKLPHQLLLFITGNFSPEREIGRGGFGIVYKGILPQRCVAVKRLYMTKNFSDRMFQDQLINLMLAQQKNIVQFLGYSSNAEDEVIECQGKLVMVERREKLLCFEYLRNGGLHCYITDASGGLEWRVRYQIIKGICEGLHYLHSNRIVHLELNPHNILLDETMVPKITHSALSRCFDQEQTRSITANMIGRLGYMAPEYLDRGIVSLKSDIYSLGIIIGEILTGHRDYLFGINVPESCLISPVIESWRTRLGTSSTDKLLEQVKVCAEISIACSDFSLQKRPNMQRVIEMLGEAEC